MKVPQFSKLSRHRRFDYTPMYYSAEKEELDDRVAKIKESIDREKEDPEFARKERMKAEFQRNSSKKMGIKSSMYSGTFRMIIILVLVIYMSYMVYTNLDGFLSGIL